MLEQRFLTVLTRNMATGKCLSSNPLVLTKFYVFFFSNLCFVVKLKREWRRREESRGFKSSKDKEQTVQHRLDFATY